MKFLKVLYLCSLSGILFSCGESATEPSDSSKLMPLEAGNYFYYDNSFYEQDGTIREVVRDTVIVSGFTMEFEKEKWIGVQHYISTSSTRLIDADFWLNKTDGLWQRAGLDAKAKYIAKFPAKAGEQFVVTRDTFHLGVRETSRKVISTNTSLTVPAGTFRVYVYKDEPSTGPYAPSVVKTDYYAPGHGLIKSEIRDLNGNLLRVNELAEYGKK